MARTSPASATEVLAGLIDRVTFHNPESGFCVLRVKARGQRDLITVVGHAPMISGGEFVQASGGWANDRTHGLQFRASFLKATAPAPVEGIEKYLGSSMIRGIGPVYAKKLVRAFGEAVFEVIEQEPRRLREVTGIGPSHQRRVYQIAAGSPDRDQHGRTRALPRQHLCRALVVDREARTGLSPPGRQRHRTEAQPWSRTNSKALRRSIRLRPWAMTRSNSTDFTHGQSPRAYGLTD